MRNSNFQIADGTEKLTGRDYEFRVPTPRRDELVRSEDLSGEIQGESGSLNQQNQQMTMKPLPTFGRFKVTSSIAITLNLEFNYVPKEETLPVLLKYIDVTWSTHTDLDVLQEKKMDDYWNVDSSKHLSDSWRGLTKFTLLKEKPPTGFLWSRERLTKIQSTTRPDHEWPEVFTKFGKATQNRENQEWVKEKPKLHNARKLRGIYFVDPEDKEYSEINKMQEVTGKTYGTSHAL